MKFKLKNFLLIPIFVVININLSAQLSTSHTLQLAAFETMAEAQAEQQRFIQLGYAPVAVAKVDYWYKVFFGHFDYYVDAFLYKMDIRKKGLSDCFIVPTYRINLPPGFGDKSTVGPLEKVLKTRVNKITQLPDYSLDGHPGYQELEALMNQAPTGEAYRTKLAWYFTNHQREDVFRGYLLTRKGVLALLDKQYDSALSYFYPVVEGKVPARRLEVIKSAKRIAWILHQKGDRAGAWQAYKEIESFTASDLVRAQCLAERAGLIVELYRAGKAEPPEVSHFLNYAIKNINENFAKQRALVEVIKSEVLGYFWDYSRAITLCEQIIAKYKNAPDCQREYAITLCNIGWFNLWEGNRDLAEEYFQRIYKEIPQNVESFANYNFFAEAKLGLAMIEEARGNIEKAQQWRMEIIKEHPNTRQSTQAQRHYETINNRKWER